MVLSPFHPVVQKLLARVFRGSTLHNIRGSFGAGATADGVVVGGVGVEGVATGVAGCEAGGVAVGVEGVATGGVAAPVGDPAGWEGAGVWDVGVDPLDGDVAAG